MRHPSIARPRATGSAAPYAAAQAAGGAYGVLFSCVGAGGRGASLPWVAEAQAEYEMLQKLVDGARCGPTLLQQHARLPCVLVCVVHQCRPPSSRPLPPRRPPGKLGGAARPLRAHIRDCIQGVIINNLIMYMLWRSIYLDSLGFPCGFWRCHQSASSMPVTCPFIISLHHERHQ